jgi:hypothetical protein
MNKGSHHKIRSSVQISTESILQVPRKDNDSIQSNSKLSQKRKKYSMFGDPDEDIADDKANSAKFSASETWPNTSLHDLQNCNRDDSFSHQGTNGSLAELAEGSATFDIEKYKHDLDNEVWV